MTSEKQNADSQTEQFWALDHDKTKCALCVVCARNCPTGALRRLEEGDTLALYYNASLCDGCKGEALCEKNCPEKAVLSVKSDVEQESGFKLLNRSEMVQCSYCQEYFAPVRRLDVVSGKGVDAKKVDRLYCPLCRRTNLVVDYIQQAGLGQGMPEYRSAKDIQRQAKLKRQQRTVEVHRKD